MAKLNELPRLKEVALKTITMAKSFNSQYLESSSKIEDVFHKNRSVDTFRKKPSVIELEKYLAYCSFEEVIGLMTVMYIGRDNYEIDAEDPNQLFTDRYNEFHKWEKHIAIDQMTSKLPLAKYLQRGMELLKL